MANSFGIPEMIEMKIRSRDQNCVYCTKIMVDPSSGGDRRKWATIEHLNWDGPFYWKDGLKKEDIVICCQSCNSSRGIKKLNEWFGSSYCTEKNINERTVAEPVKQYLSK